MDLMWLGRYGLEGRIVIRAICQTCFAKIDVTSSSSQFANFAENPAKSGVLNQKFKNSMIS